MQKFSVKIEGVTPYMQHRMDDVKLDEWEKTHNLVVTTPDVAKEDAVRAEYHCYRNGNGCYIPADHIRGAMIAAGTYVKSKVGAQTKSMKSVVAGMMFVENEHIDIPNYDTIDKRSAVNKNVKARVITVRPKWNAGWRAEFTLLVDNDTIHADMVKQILEYAGNNVGIGSFRPTNNGMFGRFKVVGFDVK
jgi:hypothetical protein